MPTMTVSRFSRSLGANGLGVQAFTDLITTTQWASLAARTFCLDFVLLSERKLGTCCGDSGTVGAFQRHFCLFV
jgi:hypothetical protein